MAGATREVIDPIEAAKAGIGSSRRLIAATLDDLSQHHSWLETYHRDERLRAERLRRQRFLERLALMRQRAAEKTSRTARTGYQAGRLAAKRSKRHTLAFLRWAAPRARRASRHAAATASEAWSWTRRRTPEFAQRGAEAAARGFNYSVRASEEAGNAFRRRMAAAYAEAAADLTRRAAPMRRRGDSAWARARLRARRGRALVEQHLVTPISESPSLARAQKNLHRWTIRGRRIGTHAAMEARQQMFRLESDLSAWLVRIVPELRRHLEAHMPDAVTATRPASGRALILRPTTALTCITPSGNRLPVLYRA